MMALSASTSRLFRLVINRVGTSQAICHIKHGGKGDKDLDASKDPVGEDDFPKEVPLVVESVELEDSVDDDAPAYSAVGDLADLTPKEAPRPSNSALQETCVRFAMTGLSLEYSQKPHY